MQKHSRASQIGVDEPLYRNDSGGRYVSEKSSLGLIEGKEALDLNALRRMYVNLAGREPTPEELADAKAQLDKAKAEDISKGKC